MLVQELNLQKTRQTLCGGNACHALESKSKV